MGPIGMQELVIIFVIALIVFGPRRLPELGKTLGKALAEFKKATNDLQTRLEDEVKEIEVAERAEAQKTTPAAEKAADAGATEEKERAS